MPALGGVPERPKGTGCKPVGSAFRGSNPLAPTSQFGSPPRAATGARLSATALLAQQVEHLHGKEGVDGSSPSEGFADLQDFLDRPLADRRSHEPRGNTEGTPPTSDAAARLG